MKIFCAWEVLCKSSVPTLTIADLVHPVTQPAFAKPYLKTFHLPTGMAPGYLTGLGDEWVGLEELSPHAETKACCKAWLEGETPTDPFVFSRPWLGKVVVSGSACCEKTNSFYVYILFFSC